MHTGHAIVKAFGRQRQAIETFEAENERLYQASYRAQFISGIIQPAMSFISNLNYVAIAVIGGLRVASGQMSLGDVVAFIQYSRQFTFPIIQTASIVNLLQSAVASAERVFELLDEPEETPETAAPQVIERARGAVTFEDVSFRYQPDKPLIDDLDLRVEAGATVAIVGPTGAGKTTLVNLLMRFYELDGGRITVDGIDTRDLTRDDLRRQFGMVLQDTWLFHGTIRENIAYGSLDATEEQIVAAAEAAHVDHFVRTLPDAYDTVIDDDATNVSAGEKQLLTIARAFLADPPILILDEATSSVDTRTEVLIQRAMARLMRGRTTFVIAHRLSTIRDADTILVMDRGHIVEQGTHAELLARRGFYYDLYTSQFLEPLAEVPVPHRGRPGVRGARRRWAARVRRARRHPGPRPEGHRQMPVHRGIHGEAPRISGPARGAGGRRHQAEPLETSARGRAGGVVPTHPVDTATRASFGCRPRAARDRSRPSPGSAIESLTRSARSDEGSARSCRGPPSSRFVKRVDDLSSARSIPFQHEMEASADRSDALGQQVVEVVPAQPVAECVEPGLPRR